jgi:hypothetical protein
MYFCSRPDQQQIVITAQCITIAVTSNTNVFLPPSRPAADLYQSAVHYNYSKKQHKRFPAAVQRAADLHQIAVQYNCINKQHKRIPEAFHTGNRSTSQCSALQLQ